MFTQVRNYECSYFQFTFSEGGTCYFYYSKVKKKRENKFCDILIKMEFTKIPTENRRKFLENPRKITENSRKL